MCARVSHGRRSFPREHGSANSFSLRILIAFVVVFGIAGHVSGCAVQIEPEAAEGAPVPLPFTELSDPDEARERYPFLAEALDEARKFNAEFPDAVPSRILVAEFPIAGSDEVLVFSQLTGVLNCGTLGCATSIHARETGGGTPIRYAGYMHEGAIHTRNCGGAITLVFGEGNGLEAGWVERQLSDFSQIWKGANLSELPECG